MMMAQTSFKQLAVLALFKAQKEAIEEKKGYQVLSYQRKDGQGRLRYMEDKVSKAYETPSMDPLYQALSLAATVCLQKQQKIDFILAGSHNRDFADMRSDIIRAQEQRKRTITKDDIL